MATRVAASDRLLVAAAPVFSAVFQRLDRGHQDPVMRSYAAVLDLDVHGEDALILGARRDAAGRWAADGAVAWIDDGKDEPRPVHFLESGQGSEVVSSCGPIDLGAVRILEDGSLLIVPGVESGVYLYSADGRLLRSWQSAQLGIAGACVLADHERAEVSTSLQARFRYWNRHVLVDDAVEWDGSPALLVRRPGSSHTSWHLLVLHRDGSVQQVSLPVVSTSGRTRARIDRRGSSVVVLLHEGGPLGEAAAFQPRLVFLEVSQ
jgi:hypothetical protein